MEYREPIFSKQDTAQQDAVDNAAYELASILTKGKLEWNMDYIGEIADAAQEIMEGKGYKTRYPAFIEQENMEYYYYMTQRPPMPGAQPRGFEIVESFDDRTPVDGCDYPVYAVIKYPRMLTEKEISDYELTEGYCSESIINK